LDKKPEFGDNTTAKVSSRGPSQEELQQIRALYAQADALAEMIGDSASQEVSEGGKESADSEEESPVVSAVQSSSMDSDPEQGDPR
jgi:hypothetical protein